MAPPIEPYQDGPAECRDYDPASPQVAEAVSAAIRAELPGLRVEHVGSTAVPGCAGKGVVDLLVPYPPGGLALVLAVLDRLGFEEQTSGNPFPADRPMRRGTVVLSDTRYRVHVHVAREGSPEADSLIAFRDRLRGDPELMAEYVKRKRAIIASGLTETARYSNAKTGFVRTALGPDDAASRPKP